MAIKNKQLGHMKRIILSVAILTLALQSFKTISYTKTNSETKNSVSKKEILNNPDKGKIIYNKICVACHQGEGQGIPNAFPPLAKSDFLNKDVNKAIKVVANGLSGEITVNGKKYNSAMPNPNLSDQDIADVLTYVYSSWGNSKKVVTTAMVKAQKK